MYFFDNYYTFSELAKLTYSFICTRLFYRGAFLVRRPIYVRGKPRIEFGKGFTTGYSCRLEVFGAKGDTAKKLIIGKNCKIGDNVHIAVAEKVIIGDNCLMASKIFISDLGHGDYSGTGEDTVPWSVPNERRLSTEPIEIGDNVWIGENVCVLKGVRIGNGVIVGANSVVTKSIPDNSIVAGVPGRVLKTFDSETGFWKAV